MHKLIKRLRPNYKATEVPHTHTHTHHYHISKGIFSVLLSPYILCLAMNKNASGRLTSKLDTAEKRISDVEDISIVTSKI